MENERLMLSQKFNDIFKQFKNDYDEIQSGPRIEIHINSLSYNGKYNDCLTDKYSMKENLQINRLIRLVDPKVEIIYVIPYELSEEILSYYYSILEKSNRKFQKSINLRRKHPEKPLLQISPQLRFHQKQK